MKLTKLDPAKLLGFRLVATEACAEGHEAGSLAAAQLGAKLGNKLGNKGGFKTIEGHDGTDVLTVTAAPASRG